MERSLPTHQAISDVFSELLKSGSTMAIESEIDNDANALYLFDKNFSEMASETLLDQQHTAHFDICGDYFFERQKKALVMWKTTTAEDRARGKIYLRGFTKVDPVEDRLKM